MSPQASAGTDPRELMLDSPNTVQLMDAHHEHVRATSPSRGRSSTRGGARGHRVGVARWHTRQQGALEHGAVGAVATAQL